MNIFTVSNFQSPEEFLALYLGLFPLAQSPLPEEYLRRLLLRTKTSPVALTYTIELLLSPNQHHLTLTLIRFVSQLADLSDGVSISSSLQNIIAEGGFLTELRHSLTHKALIEKEMLGVARKIILGQLRGKYWQILKAKTVEMYDIDLNLLEMHYSRIFGVDSRGDLGTSLGLRRGRSIERLLECSNYEFKEHFPHLLEKEGSSDAVMALHASTTDRKRTIMLWVLIDLALREEAPPLLLLARRVVKHSSVQELQSPLVFDSLLRLQFVGYLDVAKNILSEVPFSLRSRLEEFWEGRLREKGGLHRPV